jgi:hypothetical protein
MVSSGWRRMASQALAEEGASASGSHRLGNGRPPVVSWVHERREGGVRHSSLAAVSHGDPLLTKVAPVATSPGRRRKNKGGAGEA